LTHVFNDQAQPVNDFWHIPITDTYNAWRAHPATNHGLAITPWTNNNNFDMWRSSRYAIEAHRPMLQLPFKSFAPDFMMPLPRDFRWLVTTEIGGWNCKGKYDQYHDLTNYFSVDFSWENIPPANKTAYTDPKTRGPTGMIPVLPAADGWVWEVNVPGHKLNGNYIVI
jgi:hypothetical protein